MMDKEEVVQRISDYCEASFVEVFQNQNCTVFREENLNAEPLDEHVVIEATADEIRLILSLSFPRQVLVASYPIKENLEEIEEAALRDWYLELANRLLGGIKNKVVAGIDSMRLGIPLRVPAQEAEQLFSDLVDKVIMIFDHEGALFRCDLGVELRGGIESLEQAEMASVDGELELF